MRIIRSEESAQLLKEDPRYAAEAYQFVSEALDFTTKSLNKPTSGPRQSGPRHHVMGSELLEGIRKYALHEYGPMAKTLLNTWGIHECRDFGQIVFNLVNKKIFGKTEDDSIDDFNHGFDFNTAFRTPFESKKKLKKPNASC